MLSSLILLSLLCGIAVEVTQLDGDSFSGDLSAWDRTTITLKVDGAEKTISTEQLLRLDFSAADAAQEQHTQRPQTDAANIYLTLTCGSQFAGSGITTTSQRQVQIARDHSPALTFPQASLKSVRLRAPSAALDESWEELSNQPHEGDALIIRKSNDSLDYLVGVVKNVTGRQLMFELDGDGIEVNFSKLEGFVLYHKSKRPLSDSMCRVLTKSGDVWNAAWITLKDGVLLIKTPSRAVTSVKLDEVAQIGFAAGNVSYLSDVTPARTKVTPLVSGPESLDSVMAFLYEPRRNESFQGTPLSLQQEDGSQSRFAKGLAIHSKSEVLFRLDGSHRKLRGLVGIDPTVTSNAEIRLRISGNERILFDESIFAQAALITLDLDIEGVRRLTIEVDYGDGTDIGDRLHLCNLRTTK